MSSTAWLRRIALLFFFLSFPASTDAAEPAPAAFSQPLFFIERSKNANTVHYEACLTEDSLLDVRQPVRAFWILWEKDSTGKSTEKLSFFEKRMAFGFSIKGTRAPDSCVMNLVCFPSRPIRIIVDEGTVRAETAINARTATLRKISVVTRERRLIPKVLSVTVHGVDAETGEEIAETITPR